MNKTKKLLFLQAVFLGVFLFGIRFANAEVIRSFDSEINVQKDGSVLIKENILYDFENEDKHGIFRDIPLTNSKGEKIDLEVLSVQDSAGLDYQYSKSKSSGVLNIKIGDPNTLITGKHNYIINYKLIGAISYLEAIDEIYWNVTGNDWKVIIEKASAKVMLPDSVTPKQKDCYLGSSGDTTKCIMIGESFTTSKELGIGEGLTVAVGFAKGVVAELHAKEDPLWLKTVKKFWPLLVPIIVFLIMFKRWYKNGRDPKMSDTIITEYDANGLTPLEASTILKQKIETKSFSAELIYLAINGYIKISESQEKILGIFSSKDYTLTLLKDFSDIRNEFDRKLLKSVFDNSSVGDTVSIADLKDKFYKDIPEISKSIRNSMITNGYYTNLPDITSSIVIGLFMFIFIMVFGSAMGTTIGTPILLTFICLLSTGIIFLVFAKLMPAKSIEGMKKMNHLLGLKKYIEVAEKDRINFHNAPEKKPEIFEKLLPFAMIFGLEKKWAEEFANIYTTPPSWYSSTTPFSTRAFASSLGSFGSMTSNAMVSSPSSSGSGGGGFSGGGGGGGGGGSW